MTKKELFTIRRQYSKWLDLFGEYKHTKDTAGRVDFLVHEARKQGAQPWTWVEGVTKKSGYPETITSTHRLYVWMWVRWKLRKRIPQAQKAYTKFFSQLQFDKPRLLKELGLDLDQIQAYATRDLYDEGFTFAVEEAVKKVIKAIDKKLRTK